MPPLFKTLLERFMQIRVVHALMAVAAIVVLCLLLQIPGAARAHIENLLADAGFPRAKVENISLSPAAIKATDITLDQYGFDTIKELKAGINWMSFLFTGNISSLDVTGIHLGYTKDTLSSGGRKLVSGLLNLPPYPVSISAATIDMTTDYGEIRVTAEAHMTPTSKKARDVKARINADQYQLGFNSTWEGTLDDAGKLDLSGTILDGRMNAGPLRISRFNGWSGLTLDQSGYAIQGQMEAGSASFMNVPLQTLSLVHEHTASQSTLVFRAGISGMPDMLYTADFLRTKENPTFKSVLTGKDLGVFLSHIEKVTKSAKTLKPALKNIDAFDLRFDFQPEKRFVGGPLPFGLSLETKDGKIANGNVLFYTDTFDVRGSIETTSDIANALQAYFKIPAANMKQNFIRLDGSAKKFLSRKTEEETVSEGRK